MSSGRQTTQQNALQLICPQELLLSKLLRTATMTGRSTQSAIEEFLQTIQEEPGQQQQTAAPAQQAGMRRSAANGSGADGGSLGAAAASKRWEASVAAAAAANGNLGEDETALASFKEQEASLMEELSTMGGNAEVQLPLQRAKTVMRQAGCAQVNSFFVSLELLMLLCSCSCRYSMPGGQRAATGAAALPCRCRC